MGVQLLQEFEQAALNGVSVQTDLLRSILRHNATCTYLLRLGLDGRSDPLAFRTCVPVVDYDAIDPFVQRIADGDASPLLCCDPITSLTLSTGTSNGRPKMIPATAASRAITKQRFLLSNAILSREFPTERDSKTLYFIYAGKVHSSKGGLKVGAASSLHLRSGNLSGSLPEWTSPMGVVLGPNVKESMYCHLLCGLLQAKYVTVISSFFAYGITEAFRFLEEVWEELCIDIHSGTLSARVTDKSIRHDISNYLRSDSQLADFIRVECQKGWSNIMKRLWPNVKYVHTILTGAMEPYVCYLKHYAGDVPLVCGDYGSSESTIGINLNPKSPPEQVSFTLVPYAAYFEFVLVNPKIMAAAPVDITGVEIDEEYEVLVTTVAGLYRYRLGDIIRITGFYHALPQFAFVKRNNVVLSLNTEKTDEKELLKLITEAFKILEQEGLELVDFAAHADHSTRPGHYAIFWELNHFDFVDHSILAQCCRNMDQSLNDPYQRGRASGTIGPLRLYIVKNKTFENLMLKSLEHGVSPVQYKTPRCIKSPDHLRILRESVIHVYSSS